MSKTPKRMPKAQRREQLLETAHKIVREQGTDALTLGYLAERAGVSKPIAYEHFKSRAGLLIALYQRMDDQHVAALLDALERAPRSLPEVAEVMSKAFMHCAATTGSEWLAFAAALKGDKEMEAFQDRLFDRYIALYRDALASYSGLPDDELHLRCIGIIGAAEAVAQQMLRGRVSEAAAAACLASLINQWLGDR